MRRTTEYASAQYFDFPDLAKIFSAIGCVCICLIWLEVEDYFNDNYVELSAAESGIFRFKTEYSASGAEHPAVYMKYFGYPKYRFP